VYAPTYPVIYANPFLHPRSEINSKMTRVMEPTEKIPPKARRRDWRRTVNMGVFLIELLNVSDY
jgi:hypothetical protein